MNTLPMSGWQGLGQLPPSGDPTQQILSSQNPYGNYAVPPQAEMGAIQPGGSPNVQQLAGLTALGSLLI